MTQIQLGMAAAYRNSLIRTRLFDSQGCSSQKWIHTTDSRESSNLQTIKRNYSGSDGDGGTNSKGDNSHPVTKIKNNVSWMMNNIKVPQITIPDWRKFAPEEMNFTESVRKNKDKIVDSLVLKKQQFKKLQMAKKQKSDETKSSSPPETKSCAFSSHIQEHNDSIVSFYDTSSLHVESQAAIKVKVNEEVIPSDTKADSKVDEAWLSRMVGLAFFSSAPVSEAQQDSKPVVRKDFVSKASIDSRTKALVHNLKQASSQVSKLKRTEDLCSHLIQFPDSRTIAMKEKCLPTLLRLHKTKHRQLKAEVSQALSLVGYVHPPKGKGVRVLSIDGGGTRGVIAIQTLKMIQEQCKTDITKCFDYVCGTSQGAILACLIFLLKVPLADAEERYMEFSQMFNRNAVLGTGKLVWDHAFYDTDLWEKILKMNFSEDKTMADCAKDDTCPKVSAISCLLNVPKMKSFMFRTYNLPPGVFSHYPGNCKHKVWEAIRASSAAPVYLKEFVLGDFIHQDGGLMANNPAAIAVSECKLLWPDEAIQCVISLGNGRFEPNLEITPSKNAVKEKVAKIIDAATNTEVVHTILQDLLPTSTYFRFNPYMSEDIRLDEKRTEKLIQMQQDTEMYLRKNEFKLKCATDQLLKQRQPHQQALDYIKLKADSSFLADSNIL
ncbi:calcium-independent phospholipase A2-gamma-like [Mytilus californianus]|uniref:calcium-independent phospholipase A2-gamma-like n=1 Tax=Mytilus californianus TaxID=6549 RepID=UPI0022460C77|nr:calcium-independent phospholipase A2-gamma-like [Mytilus californianus]